MTASRSAPRPVDDSPRGPGNAESAPGAAGARRRHGRAARALFLFLLYQGVAWGTLMALAAGLAPWAPWLVLAFVVYTAVPLAIAIRYRGWPFYPTRAFRVLVVRAFLYAQLMLPFLGAAGLLGLGAGAFFGEALRGGRLAVAGTGVVLLLLLLAGYVGARRLATRELIVHMKGLPHAFDGYRIVQISDLHVGPQTWRGYLTRVADTVAALQPDLIAVTGDMVDDRTEDAAIYTAAVRHLTAPDGMFMVPGNHDVYAGWKDLAATLVRLPNARLLVNQSHVVRRGKDALVVAGTGDPAGRSVPDEDVAPDIARTLANVPAGVPVVALAHNPALWPELAARGVQLTLSGHTHWGQLAIPALRWSLASPFLEHAMGLHRDGDSVLFIHPGTGYWGVPFRLGTPAEVTCITLRAQGDADDDAT